MGLRNISSMIEWLSRLNGPNGLNLLLYLIVLWECKAAKKQHKISGVLSVVVCLLEVFKPISRDHNR